MKISVPKIVLHATVFACSLLLPRQATAQLSGDSYTNTILPGMNLIANQLDHSSNTLDDVLPNVPDDSQVYKWNEADGTFHIDSFYAGELTWIDGSSGGPSTTTLGAYEAAFLYNPGAAYQLGFAGQVRTNGPPPPALVPEHFYFLSGPVNAAASFEDITGLAPEEGALFINWTAATQKYQTNRFTDGVWQLGVPAAGVGEGVVIWLPIADRCCPAGATVGPELVINPDFSAGNSGFTSDYSLLSYCSPGLYTVANSLTVGGLCNNWTGLDHTAGTTTGNFFVADGSQTLGQAAWRQQFNLSASTRYAFCAWVNNLNEPGFDRPDPIVQAWLVPASGPAVLLASSGALPESPDNWVQISAAWSSPAVPSNPYRLEIRTAGTSFEGNNFALDDISFRVCSTTPPCIPPPANMVLWLPFDETSGTTAQNLAGANNGTHVNGPAYNPGSYVANSLCFDGVNDYVQVPSYPAIGFGTNDFTVDAWVKPAALESTIRIIVDHRESSANGVIGYSLFLGGNNGIGFQIGDGNFINYPSTLSVPADGHWHLVAVTVKRNNAQGIHFYVDGVQQVFGRDTIPYNGSVTPAANFPLRVGARSFSPDGIFNGCIDEVELFNRELAAAEITAIYNAGSAGKCKPTIHHIPIGILQAGTNIVLSWSGTATDFNLEETPNLQGTDTVWTTVTNAPTTADGAFQVTLPVSQPKGYFRLRGPGNP